MDEFLIECIRQYPCLWDTKLPTYKQLDVKDAAWKDIIKKTKIESVTVAKIKWKNLRDTHREKLKKINKTKSGQAQKNIKPWKYMSHMEFLLPYMTNTERDTNVPSPDFSSVLNETPSSVDAEVSRGSDSMPAQKKRKDDEENNDQDDFLVKLLKEVDDNRERRMVQREELRKGIQTPVDSLKAFFDSMYQSTQQMPEFYQRSIKRKLFQLVMDAEDDIANTNYSYSGYYTSNACNSRPSTNQTNYSSEYAPTTSSAQPSGSGLQQARSLEDSMAADNTTQDTNYSSEYAPTTSSAQPSGSGLQQARSLEDSMAADNTTQDITSKSIV